MDFSSSSSLWNSRFFSIFTTLKLKFSRLTNRFPTRAEDSTQQNYTTTTTVWSELQTDVLELILKKLPFIDILRFGAVCSSWKTAMRSYTFSPFYNPSPQTPWFMLDMDERSNICSFFNLTETRSYDVKIRSKFHDHSWKLGSSNGLSWFFNEITGDVVLFNLFSGDEFQLPSMSSLVTHEKMCGDYVGKIVLSSNPRRSKNFSVAITYTMRDQEFPETLAFCQDGDETWTPTQLMNQSYSDIICHNDQIHALSITRCAVDIWDFLSPFPKKVVDFESFPIIPTFFLDQWFTQRELIEWFPFRTQENGMCWNTRFVKSMGEILNVEQFLLEKDDGSLSTIGFVVSRFDYGERSWKHIQALPDRAIFVDVASSAVSVSTLDCPELEANSIYFVDDDDYLRVYNIKEGKIFNKKKYQKWKIVGSCLWFIPNPW